MSGRQISIREASVRTATVEVKSLTISGKQVTLAVFRQLINEPIIAEPEPALLGLPWGTVNYHPDKCAEDPRHLHVVWQKGGELRRAEVRLTGEPAWYTTARWQQDALARLAIARDVDETGELTDRSGHSYASTVRLQSAGGSASFGVNQEAEAVRDLARIRRGQITENQYVYVGHKTCKGPAEARAAALGLFEVSELREYAGLTGSETWLAYLRMREEAQRRLAAYQRIVGDLEALDQLFIAV